MNTKMMGELMLDNTATHLAAEKNLRRKSRTALGSMNGEMVARIDGSLDLESKYEEMRQLNRYLLMRIEMLEQGSNAPESASLKPEKS